MKIQNLITWFNEGQSKYSIRNPEISDGWCLYWFKDSEIQVDKPSFETFLISKSYNTIPILLENSEFNKLFWEYVLQNANEMGLATIFSMYINNEDIPIVLLKGVVIDFIQERIQ